MNEVERHNAEFEDPSFEEVLDRGFIRLVTYLGDDLLPARSARVSYGRKTKGDDKDKKLLERLAKDGHESPFEFNEFIFHVKAPIFVARQWMRHRIASYGEKSGRYTTFKPTEWYIPDASRAQHSSNKQMSKKPDYYELSKTWTPILKKQIPTLDHWHTHVTETMSSITEQIFHAYEYLVDTLGVSRELARIILPVNMYTEFYFKINGRSLSNFLKLRLAEDAQQEIRDYANAILQILEHSHPFYVKILKEHWLK